MREVDSIMGKKLNLKWVSETIGQEYTKWNKGDSVFIQAQTGTGKSEFIKKKIVPMAEYQEKKILYLCNRINLCRQVKLDLLKLMGVDVNEEELDLDKLDKRNIFGNVTVVTYQKIQQYIVDKKYGVNVYGKVLNDYDRYDGYDYIVMDEIHSIVQDASYNNHTLFFFENFLKNYQHTSITIYISATMDVIKPIIKRVQEKNNPMICGKSWEYTTGNDFSYINTYYFSKYNDIINTINNDESGHKWLVFISNADKGVDLHEKITNSAFICSENNKHKDKINQEEKVNIINQSKFNCKCLIATKTLDNGINFNDPLLTNIVILALDKIDFLQMLGRKRIDINDADEVNLYIPAKSKKTFTTIKNKTITPIIEQVKLYYDNQQKFRRIYNPNQDKLGKYNKVFYTDVNNELKINNIAYFKIIKQEEFCDYMAVRFKLDYKTAYIYEQLGWIDGEYNEANWVQDVVSNKVTDALSLYLEGMLGQVMLNASDRVELIEIINVRDGKNNRLLKNINTLNAKLEETGINFIIKQFETSKMIDGKKKKYKQAWKVMKLSDK